MDIIFYLLNLDSDVVGMLYREFKIYKNDR